MADSIREQIVENVKATLEGIDGVGDFTETVETVQRFEQSFDNDGNMDVSAYGRDNLPTIILNAFGSEKIDGSANRTRRRMLISLATWLLHNNEVDSRTSDEILNAWAQDIERALMDDHTRGGLAYSTEVVMDQQIFDLAKFPDYIGIESLVEIIYQHKRTDPGTA